MSRTNGGGRRGRRKYWFVWGNAVETFAPFMSNAINAAVSNHQTILSATTVFHIAVLCHSLSLRRLHCLRGLQRRLSFTLRMFALSLAAHLTIPASLILGAVALRLPLSLTGEGNGGRDGGGS